MGRAEPIEASAVGLQRPTAQLSGPRNITANVVSPGGIVTDIGDGIMKNPDLQKVVIEQTPLGRMGQPEDIGKLVAALASDDFGWVTGQRIEATGGFRL